VALAVPAVIAGSAGRAAADSGSLVVTLLDKQGQAVNTTLGVTPLDTPGAATRPTTSGTGHTLPAGRYALLTSTFDGDPQVVTLGARVVTVADGATTAVTVDARQGRELRITLDGGPGAGYAQAIGARACVGGRPAGGYATSNAEPGRVFVIPNDDPGTQLGYVSNWMSPTDKDAYSVAGTVPLTVDPITVPLSSTGTVAVRAMTGPASQNTEGTEILPQPLGSACDQGLYAPPIGVDLPSARDFHATPGSWRFTDDTWHGDTAVATGGRTAVDFGRAVWGPARYLPFVQKGRLGFFTSGMVADPLLTGVDVSINATATLYRDGTAIATGTGLGNSPSAKGPRTFWAPITRSAAYTLKVHGYRHATGVPQPAGMMSTATDVSFSFHAGPSSNAVPPAFLTHFTPNGLDLGNRLPAGHATTVPLILDRTSSQAGVPMWPAAAKKIEVFGSTDGGRSWHGLTVIHSGDAWAFTLPAQRSGAELSLSARVTDTGGDRTVTTVYRAFTIA
jgi:hypothetical protein